MREERLAFPCGELTLEGVLHRPEGTPQASVVVCHPHPLYGGDMHNHVVVAVCRALAAAGLAALRFNFRGVGASQGAFAGGLGEQEDVRAALDKLAEVAPGPLGLAGYSFGAVVAAAVAPSDERVAALALLSPPPLNLPREALGRWPRPKLLAVGDSDTIAPLERLQEVADGLSEPRELLTFSGADHFWLSAKGGLAPGESQAEELARAVADFFRRWLAGG